MGMPLLIIMVICLQHCIIMSFMAGSMGMISQVMPLAVMEQVILHIIIGIGMPPICIPPIGMPPIMGIMPLMAFIMGIIAFIMGIMAFMGFIIGIMAGIAIVFIVFSLSRCLDQKPHYPCINR